MPTARASNYSAGTGEDILIGILYNSPLALLASTLNVGDMTELTDVTGLNTLDGTGEYPNEGGGKIAQDWTHNSVWIQSLQKGYHSGAGAGFIGDGGANSIMLINDANTNNWSSARNPLNVSLGHGYSANTLMGTTLLRMPFGSAAQVLAWDCVNDVAIPSNIPNVPSNIGGSAAWNGVHAIVFMPNIGTSGTLFHVNNSLGRLNKYDIALATGWVNIATGLNIPNSAFGHYNPHSNRMVFGGNTTGNPIYTMGVDEVPTLTGNLPANVYSEACFIAAPNSNDSLLYSGDGTLNPIDTTTGVWKPSSTIPVLSGAQINDSIAMSMPEHNCIQFETYSAGGNSTVHLHRYS